MSIQSAIQDFLKRDIYPFHMPGHKRNPAFLPSSPSSLDITEIDGMDNLHMPGGIILRAQERAAAIYGAKESRLLVNGGSVGLMASILALCREGDEIIIAGNAHRSVHSGLVLSGARPIYVMSGITNGIDNVISAEEIKQALSEYPSARAILVTSPSYEGAVADIAAISALAHGFGIPLIVDEAHGAHFPFSEYFPKTAVSLGADIAVCGLHKTLPCYGQTALINMREGLIDGERLDFFLSALQTTSPSYMLLAQADEMISLFERDKSYFEAYVRKLSALRAALGDSLKNSVLLDKAYVSAYNYDSSKICLSYGGELAKADALRLLRGEGVEPEMLLPDRALFMTSVADTDEGFSRLLSAALRLDAAISPKARKTAVHDREGRVFAPELSPKECLSLPSERARPEAVVGRVCRSAVVPYPPGVPVIFAGELVGESARDLILALMRDGHSLIGLGEDGTMEVAASP